MPYSMLINKDTRESLGVSLRDNIVICDEANNIVEAINAMHSVTVTATELTAASQAVASYTVRYASRLSGKNMFYIRQFQHVLGRLEKFVTATTSREMCTITIF